MFYSKRFYIGILQPTADDRRNGKRKAENGEEGEEEIETEEIHVFGTEEVPEFFENQIPICISID